MESPVLTASVFVCVCSAASAQLQCRCCDLWPPVWQEVWLQSKHGCQPASYSDWDGEVCSTASFSILFLKKFCSVTTVFVTSFFFFSKDPPCWWLVSPPPQSSALLSAEKNPGTERNWTSDWPGNNGTKWKTRLHIFISVCHKAADCTQPGGQHSNRTRVQFTSGPLLSDTPVNT